MSFSFVDAVLKNQMAFVLMLRDEMVFELLSCASKTQASKQAKTTYSCKPAQQAHQITKNKEVKINPQVCSDKGLLVLPFRTKMHHFSELWLTRFEEKEKPSLVFSRS